MGNYVAYLDNTPEYNLVNLTDAGLFVTEFDDTFTYAVLVNVSDFTNMVPSLYRINAARTEFEPVTYLNETGDPNILPLYWANQLHTKVSSGGDKIVLTSWTPEMTPNAPAAGAYLIGRADALNGFEILRFNIWEDMISPPKAHVSPKMTKVGISYATTERAFVEASSIFYEWGYVQDLMIPPQIQAITGLLSAEVVVGDRFLLLHVYPLDFSNHPQEEWIFRFKDNQMLLVSEMNFTGDAQSYYRRAVLKETKGDATYVFRQYEIPVKFKEMNIQITKDELTKEPVAVPNLDNIVMDENVTGADADGI